MDTRKYILKETALVALGQFICASVMCGIFALLSAYDKTVLLGSIVGTLVSVANFFFMSLGAMLAADKAAAQNVKGGKATIRLSFTGRLVLMAVILFAFAKSGLCNVVALVLPLAFTRPVLTIAHFFKKAGEPTK